MRTVFHITTRLTFRVVPNKFSKYTGLFLGNLRIAFYTWNLQRITTDPNIFSVYSAVRNIPLGGAPTESQCKEICLQEAMHILKTLQDD